MTFQTISVIGLGYIGLPTASLLAAKGYSVTGVDINPKVVETINSGGIHIYEPDMDVLVRSAVNSGRLKARLAPEPADVYIISVPTPFKEGRKPDVSYVERAAESIAGRLKPGNLVIVESTCPVGSTERVAAIIGGLRPDLSVPAFGRPSGAADANRIHFAHCPERVLPGKILIELVENDRVIGGLDEESGELAKKFYQTFVNGRIFVTDCRTAEMVKLTENAYRDVNIAFANELSMICGDLGMDVMELIELANHHPRVNVLRPGAGVGGHCIAVDPWFIVDSSPRRAKLIRAAREVNDFKPHWVVERIKEAAKGFANPVIAVLGLAYKPDIDDFRESPSMEIAKILLSSGAGKIIAVEPHKGQALEDLAGMGAEITPDAGSAIAMADVVALLVGHSAFKEIPAEALKGKIVLDAAGFWDGLLNDERRSAFPTGKRRWR